MIAGRRHGHREPLKDGLVIVHDRTGFTVHEMRGANDPSAESLADRLMSKTNTQQWSLAGKMADQVDAEPSFVWSARPGRDHDSLWPHCFNFFDSNLIVAADPDISPQFSQILDQVVGERIVIIEDENHVPTPGYQGTPKSSGQ